MLPRSATKVYLRLVPGQLREDYDAGMHFFPDEPPSETRLSLGGDRTWTESSPVRSPMDVQPISALKATMPAVLRSMRENRRPIMVVSKGRPQAVLQDVASYEGTQDSIALLKMMLQSEKSVAAKRGSSTKDMLARLRGRVRAQAVAP